MQLPPELIAEWEAGALSSQALSAKYGIARRTIETKLASIPRDPNGARRAGVRAGIARAEEMAVQAEAAKTIMAEEIGRDVAALSLSAQNALAGLTLVAASLAEGGHAPRAILQLMQANSAALESWRRARDLDAPEGNTLQDFLTAIAGRGGLRPTTCPASPAPSPGDLDED